MPGNRISQIVAGQRNITSDTALRLGHYFGTSPQFWLDLQAAYDLRLAETKTGAAIKRLPTLTARRKRPSHAGPPPAALRGIARGADTQIKREPDRPL